jgi:hypothetical protein
MHLPRPISITKLSDTLHAQLTRFATGLKSTKLRSQSRLLTCYICVRVGLRLKIVVLEQTLVQAEVEPLRRRVTTSQLQLQLSCPILSLLLSERFN